MEDKRFWTEYKQTFPDFNLFLSYSRYTFNPLEPLPNILNFHLFKDLSAILKWQFCLAFFCRNIDVYLDLSFVCTPPKLVANKQVYDYIYIYIYIYENA